MATIYDIARDTRLSPSSVSRALQGSRLVSPKVREMVEEAAARLGYTPRVIRRSRARSILSVRLVLPQPRNPARGLFYDVTELIAGLNEGFGGSTVHLSCELAASGYEPFPHKKGGDIDAFVFAFHTPEEPALEAIRNAGIPFVVLNRTPPGVPSIGTNHLAGMRALLSHLLASHSPLRPIFIGLERMGEIHEGRRAAFIQAAEEAGLAVGEEHCQVFSSLDAIRGQDLAPLLGRANALLAVNDIVGILVLEELLAMGVRVPREIAVTGFDDSPLRRLSRPLLTTFSLPVRALGARAGQRLQSEIMDKQPGSNQELLEGRLLVGASSGHPY